MIKSTEININKPLPAILIMVCIYVFLVIERPWESIRYLQGIPVERVYAILLIIVAFLSNKFHIAASPVNKWVYGLLTIHFLLAPFAFNSADAVDQGIEYAKMVVLYLLMLAVVDDEWSLKVLVKTYALSTMLYALHSLWEYHNGRYVWRMDTKRMVGVDLTYNDPNSFGATLVLSLPIVYALLRSETNGYLRKLYYSYFLLVGICVVLTGSRSSFAVLLLLLVIWAALQPGLRKLLIFATVLLATVLAWNVMPEEKQNRFRTLWNEEAGPLNAQVSAEGRLQGWMASWQMFRENPMTGVGAGGKNFIGYRSSHHTEEDLQSSLQSHVLYGEVLAEFGLFGALLFVGLVLSIWRCCRWARAQLALADEDRSFAYSLSGAILVALTLLLVFGISGHNFYRPLWLWLAAWSGSLFMIGLLKVQDQEASQGLGQVQS